MHKPELSGEIYELKGKRLRFVGRASNGDFIFEDPAAGGFVRTSNLDALEYLTPKSCYVCVSLDSIWDQREGSFDICKQILRLGERCNFASLADSRYCKYWEPKDKSIRYDEVPHGKD